MKSLTIILALVFSLQFGFSQEDKTQSIMVTIDNVKNDSGKVLLSLHNAETFMKSPGLQNAESEIKDGKITITFKGLTPGTYAIMAIHDENNNKQMDFDTVGMPIESYGMSNNPVLYGPPQFANAKFELTDEDLELAIRF